MAWSDETSKATADAHSTIEKAYFGTVEDTGWNSLKTYFDAMSFSQIAISGFVSSWYTSTMSYASIAASPTTGTEWYTDFADIMIAALADFATKNPSFDTSGYDVNNDGYIDNVQFINTGNRDSAHELSWAFQTDSSQFFKALSKTNPTIGTLKLGNVAWSNLGFLGSPSDYVQLPEGSIGTRAIIHEFGHVIGIPDYYDTEYTQDTTADRNYLSAVGDWDMQAANCLDWNSFSKFSSGFVDPYVVRGNSGSVSVDLRPAATSGDCLIIPAKSQDYNGTPFDEYLLIDLYTPEGLNEYDAGVLSTPSIPASKNDVDLMTPGLRIYHVDASLVDNALEFNNVWGEAGGYLLNLLQEGGTPTFTMKTEWRHSWTSSDLWKAGDSFQMANYSSSFVSGKFNNGLDLGYTISVDSLSSASARVTITAA